MAFIEFLFVLALAVIPACFMLFCINKMLKEYKEISIRDKNRQPIKNQNVKADSRRKNQQVREGENKRRSFERKNTNRRKVPQESRQRVDSSIERNRQAGTSYRAPGTMHNDVRSNFDNSRMKQKYEENLRKQQEGERTSSGKSLKHKPIEKGRISKHKKRKERREKKRVRE